MKSKLLLSTLVGVFTSHVEAATLLYATNFNAPTYADGTLVGQDGWAQTGTTATTPIQVSNTATNGVANVGNTGQDINHPLGASGVAGSVFYVSATINVSAAQTTGDYFLHLSDGTTGNFFARVWGKSTTGGFLLAFLSSSTSPAPSTAYGTTVLTIGTSYDILFRYDYVAGTANDTGALFVNPTTADGSGDTPYVALTNIGPDPTGALATVNFRQGTSTAAPTLTVDNLSVSGDLVAAPEPASALLGALGLLTIFRRRR